MAVYNIETLGKLADKLGNMGAKANQAAAQTLNKTATFAIQQSIEEITRQVSLSASYVRGKIQIKARASSDNLRTIIYSNTRGTLLKNYPFSLVAGAVRVAVNRTGGYRDIPGARIMTLRGSGQQTIGVRNKDAVEIFRKAIYRGQGITSAKAKKMARIEARAKARPYGMIPLHSRSINQLFSSAREDIAPEIKRFIHSEFLHQLNRLTRWA